MNTEYTHQQLCENITCLAGFYTVEKEARLKYDGREVLYVVGRAVIEASCCGIGDWGYILVPGYIMNWQTETNAAGCAVSEVEPVSDDTARADLRQIIREAENISQIEFW